MIGRDELESDLAALSKAERRSLRALGARIDRLTLSLPDQAAPAARALAGAFLDRAAPGEPAADRAPRPPAPSSSPGSSGAPRRLLGLAGFVSVAGWRVAVEDIERLGAMIGAAARRGEGLALSPQTLAALRWAEPAARSILTGLGFRPGGSRPGATGELWRPRKARAAPVAIAAPTPFSALAALGLASPAARRRRPRGKRRA